MLTAEQKHEYYLQHRDIWKKLQETRRQRISGIYCACGCGQQVKFRNGHTVPQFVNGHQSSCVENFQDANQERHRQAGIRHWSVVFQGLIFQPRQCFKCGKLLAETLSGFRRVCIECRSAARRAHNNRPDHGRSARHRCRIFGLPYESFSSLSILERDNWTCQICGIATPKARRGTIESDAPEIDHIWPLGAKLKGPGHVPSNVRCACRKCNLGRSNKFIGMPLGYELPIVRLSVQNIF